MGGGGAIGGYGSVTGDYGLGAGFEFSLLCVGVGLLRELMVRFCCWLVWEFVPPGDIVLGESFLECIEFLLLNFLDCLSGCLVLNRGQLG
jgi:hypothetical protein